MHAFCNEYTDVNLALLSEVFASPPSVTDTQTQPSERSTSFGLQTK